MTPPDTIAETGHSPLLPPITPEELARRNRVVIAMLDEWAADEASEQDQKETMEILRKALGPERIASYRPAIR